MSKLSASAAPVQAEVVDYAAHQQQIHRIRDRVFIQEQAVPADLERDDRDALCLHVLAYADGQAVGTGRIDLQRAGKIGRVAVLADARTLGVGRVVMEALHRCAADAGLAQVRLSAQQSAVPFYHKLGYTAVGEPFVEAGIVHLAMARAIGTG